MSPLKVALDELSRRDLSTAELHSLLARRGFLPPEIEEAFLRLETWGIVSDERAALALLRKRSGRNARGDLALREEMESRGLDPAIIEGLLSDEGERASELLRLKFPQGFEPAKGARFLASRGFGEEAIRSALPPED